MKNQKYSLKHKFLGLLLSFILLSSSILTTYAAYDLNGNNIDASINSLIQQTDQRLSSTTTTWATAGRTVTNLPITDWKRSSNSVVVNRLVNGVSQDFYWSQLSGLNQSFKSSWQVWDGSRQDYHYSTSSYGSLLKTGQRTVYNNRLYDSATWNTRSDVYFNDTFANEELRQFKGTFKLDKNVDINDLFLTLSSDASDDTIYLNDDMYVFVYPSCLEGEINDNNYINYLAFWCGTITTVTGGRAGFHNIPVTTAYITEATGLNTLTSWHMDAVQDNVGAAMRRGYNQVKNRASYDGTYTIRVIAGDVCGGGGMYRLKLGYSLEKVIYMPNGGSGTMDKQTASAAGIKIQNNGFSAPSGKYFVGWNTKPDGSGTSYAPGSIYRSNSGMILYAQWKDAYYYVDYKGNGNTGGSMSKQTIQRDKSTALTKNTFIKNGYHFTGWNTQANGKGTSFKDQQSVKNIAERDKTITLYAQWQENKYDIYFDGNGATKGKKDPVKAINYESKIDLNMDPQNPFERLEKLKYDDKDLKTEVTDDIKYSFVGWHVDPNVIYTNNTILRDTPQKPYASYPVKDIVNLKGEGLNDKVPSITCYAIWDQYPQVSARWMYFTKTELREGKLSERNILNNAIITDREDGALAGSNVNIGTGTNIVGNPMKVILEDFNTADFDNLGDRGYCTVTYKVTDGFGNITRKVIRVYVYEDGIMAGDHETDNYFYNRHITEEFYNKGLKMIEKKYSDENAFELAKHKNDTHNVGGFYADSVWYNNSNYQKALEKAFANLNNDTSVITYHFTLNDIKASQQYVQEHGVGKLGVNNIPNPNGLKDWQTQFKSQKILDTLNESDDTKLSLKINIHQNIKR